VEYVFHGNVSLAVAQALKELQKRIAAAQIPPSKLDETLNLATWNIREFGKVRRKDAAIHYIAEILGQFDVVSIVELRDDLTDLSRVLDILGPYWHAVYSDMIPDPGGNRERIAFIYDKRAAAFSGFASSVNPPRKKSGTEYKPEFSWWRTPYMASFSAGNFDFVIITAHIQWGTAEGRLKELKSFSSWVKLKSNQKTLEDKDILVTGDFNIETPAMYDALVGQDLHVPSALKKKEFGTNLARDKRYDQILHLQRYPDSFMNKGGILDFYTGGTSVLLPGVSKQDFTFQLSDHLPLWVQINTNNDGFQLDQLIRARKAG
jgi:endonuclease/exonuclease/phosphatase family metal-dependent hydrolase